MNLLETIEKLKIKDEVDSVFITGSQGDENKPYSDIDLVIILNQNTDKIKSIYTWIDNKFADIFFFDLNDLDRITNSKKIKANSMDAIFLAWLKKANIQFDKSGQVTDLKNTLPNFESIINFSESDKAQSWQKINYNFVANKRYFESNDTVYHEALEIRLMYSIPELLLGYFEFRNIAWRGEKDALKFLKENDLEFYNLFLEYTKSQDISSRFNCYSKMVKKVFVSDYAIWITGQIIAESKDDKIDSKNQAKEYWFRLSE